MYSSKNACGIAPLYDIEQAIIDAYDYLGLNINQFVPQLFFNTQNYPLNNFHNRDNFKWVKNPWDFDPNDYPLIYESSAPHYDTTMEE